MEVYGGVSHTAILELTKQHHLTSGEKRRKRIDEEDSEPPPLPDEAQVKAAEQAIQKNQQQLADAQRILVHLPPARLQKLEAVHQRIHQGFYHRKEVLEAVAERLLVMFKLDERTDRHISLPSDD